MTRHEPEQAPQLVREKYLYRYSAALERSDFAQVAEILREAEADADLERMLLEVNQIYEAEMMLPAQAENEPEKDPAKGGILMRLGQWIQGVANMGNQQGSGNRTLKRGLLAAGCVLALFICVFFIFSMQQRGGVFQEQSFSAAPATMVAGEMGAVRDMGGFGDDDASAAFDAAEPAPDLFLEEAMGADGIAGQNAVEEAPRPAPQPGAPDANSAFQPAERLIIRSGNITMLVEDMAFAQASVETIVAELANQGAFVVSSQQGNSGAEALAWVMMSIRVPAGEFDAVMDRLADLAVRVTDRNESAQDVTEEYVDLDARLESLEAARQRLLDIVANADTTEDLLLAEEQLTQREAQIERIKGRLQYLTQAAALSDIHITLRPEVASEVTGGGWRPGATARNALTDLRHDAQEFGDFLIVFAIAIVPWLLLLGIVLYLVFRVIRWRIRAGRTSH